VLTEKKKILLKMNMD